MATSAYLRTANQPPPLEGYDLFSENRPLVEALVREGAYGADARLDAAAIVERHRPRIDA